MKTGYRKILRDVRRDKGRTILVVLSIAVGVFAVTDVEGELRTTVRWRPNPDTPWRDAPLIVRDDFTRQKLDRVELLAGRWPDDREVVVEHNAVGFFGIPVGGSVTLSIGDRGRGG